MPEPEPLQSVAMNFAINTIPWLLALLLLPVLGRAAVGKAGAGKIQISAPWDGVFFGEGPAPSGPRLMPTAQTGRHGGRPPRSKPEPAPGSGVFDPTRIKRQICSEFPYTPPAKDEAEEQGKTTPDDNVIVLPTYTVSGARLMREVEHAVAKAQWKLEEKRFDWENGGAIKEFKFGGKTIEIGVWPKGPSLTFLQIKW